jgi:hypothetical protein
VERAAIFSWILINILSARFGPYGGNSGVGSGRNYAGNEILRPHSHQSLICVAMVMTERGVSAGRNMKSYGLIGINRPKSAHALSIRTIAYMDLEGEHYAHWRLMFAVGRWGVYRREFNVLNK